MFRYYSRRQIAEMSANKTIGTLDRKKGTVTLQGAQFPVRIDADQDGTATVVFDSPGIYFGQDKFEIASHRNNNFTAHALEDLTVEG